MRTKEKDGLHLRSPRFNMLLLLHHLYGCPKLTQARLAALTGLSVAMVNNYLKEMCASGTIEYHRKSSRVVTYHLTQEGLQVLDRLRNEFTAATLRLYAEEKERMREKVLRVGGESLHEVILFGAGDRAEIAFHALEDAHLHVSAICDEDTARIGTEWCGRAILSCQQIRHLRPDAVVVAGAPRSETAARVLEGLAHEGVRLIHVNGYTGADAAPAETDRASACGSEEQEPAFSRSALGEARSPHDR